MPKRYRPWIAGMVGILFAVVIGAGIAASLAGEESAAVTADRTIQRVRAHNLKLQAVLLELMRSRPGSARGSRQPVRSPGGQSAPAPATSADAVEPPAEEDDCDPNYTGACLDPTASDYDCEGGSGNGPDYIGVVTVVGDDHFGLDRDGDGIGCEAE